jgi:hypothetical protein
MKITAEQKQSLEIANTIRKQLCSLGQVKVWSWGANGWLAIPNGLLFKVQGFLFKGKVAITLKNDTYTIQLIKGQKIIKEFTEIFFDEMVDLIDTNVEYTGANYEKDVDNAVYQF